MPEIISKYPEVTIKVLESAGAVCAKGAPQRILKACLQERFCSFPSGEICVYGLDEIEQMTQITKPELAQVIGEVGKAEPVEQMKEVKFDFGDFILIGLALIIGFGVGYLIKSRKE